MSGGKISKKGKIGNGVYGMVYKGEIEKKNGKVREVAVKRNWSDPASVGTSTIREMNFLMSVKHPCITKCKKNIRRRSIHKGDCSDSPGEEKQNERG